MQDLQQLHKQAFSIYPLCSPVDVFSPWAHENGSVSPDQSRTSVIMSMVAWG